MLVESPETKLKNFARENISTIISCIYRSPVFGKDYIGPNTAIIIVPLLEEYLNRSAKLLRAGDPETIETLSNFTPNLHPIDALHLVAAACIKLLNCINFNISGDYSAIMESVNVDMKKCKLGLTCAFQKCDKTHISSDYDVKFEIKN